MEKVKEEILSTKSETSTNDQTGRIKKFWILKL
jgi:hypothetical protein